MTNGVEPVIDLAAEEPAVEGHHHGLAGGQDNYHIVSYRDHYLAGGQEHRIVVGQPVRLTLAQLASLSHCVKHIGLQHLKDF